MNNSNLELRFVMKSKSAGDGFEMIGKVLQYRESTNYWTSPEKTEITKVWSEWTDVPLVFTEEGKIDE